MEQKVITPDPKEVKASPEVIALRHKIEQAQTELGYHENSGNRIDEIRGQLGRIDIKGSDAIAFSESFHWLKGVKQNVKFMVGKIKEDLKKFNDELQAKEGGDNADKNKK